MDSPDVLRQIRTGVKALRTKVPAAGVSQGLGGRGPGTALSIQHGRGGTPAGHYALHIHQGAATGAERRGETEMRLK